MRTYLITPLTLLLATLAQSEPHHGYYREEDYNNPYGDARRFGRVWKVDVRKPAWGGGWVERLGAEQEYIRTKYAHHPSVRPSYIRTSPYRHNEYEYDDDDDEEEKYGYEEKYDYGYKPKPKPKKKKEKKKGTVAVNAGDDPFEFIGEIEIGTPPQKLRVRFDTSTQLSWVHQAVVEEKPKKKKKPKKTYDEYESYDTSYNKDDDYDDEYDYEPPTRNKTLPGFDPASSSTFQPTNKHSDMTYYDSHGNPTDVAVDEGKDIMSVGGVGVVALFGVRKRDQASAASEGIDGHFGLSLKSPKMTHDDPWLYEAIKHGLCDPIFALTPPARPNVTVPDYDTPIPTPGIGKREQKDYGYEKPKESVHAQLSICGYEGTLPRKFNEVTKTGLDHGFWQFSLTQLKLGKHSIPLVPEPPKSYGYDDKYKKEDKEDKKVDALMDTGSPFIVLPKVAVKKIHKLIGATCPGDKKKDEYGDEYGYGDKEEKGSYEGEKKKSGSHHRRAENATPTPQAKPTTNTTTGFFRTTTLPDLCTVPCHRIRTLSNITFTFSDDQDHNLDPAEYIQRGPTPVFAKEKKKRIEYVEDGYGGKKEKVEWDVVEYEVCYSVFTTFEKANQDAAGNTSTKIGAKAGTANALDKEITNGDRLAVLGTAFTQVFATVYNLGDVASNSGDRDLDEDANGNPRRLGRRQLTTASLGRVPGIGVIRQVGYPWRG